VAGPEEADRDHAWRAVDSLVGEAGERCRTQDLLRGVELTVLKCPKACVGKATLLSPAGSSTRPLTARTAAGRGAAGRGAAGRGAAGRGAAGRGAAGRTVKLGSVSFKLRANHTTQLRIPLTTAGRKLVKGKKALDVTLTVKLKLAGVKKPTTYTQTLVLVSIKGKIPPAKVRPKPQSKIDGALVSRAA
jgi:hypothetical protein